jgi:hypothetical protein
LSSAQNALTAVITALSYGKGFGAKGDSSAYRRQFHAACAGDFGKIFPAVVWLFGLDTCEPVQVALQFESGRQKNSCTLKSMQAE